MEMKASDTDEDARCITTFTFTKENFSQLKDTEDVNSPLYMIHNTPWNIMIRKNSQADPKTLEFYLMFDENSVSTSWSCEVTAELTVVSQMEDVEDRSKELDRTFSKDLTDWGWDDFMEWDVLINPDNGYIKDDTVIFRAEVNADSPQGISSDCQKRHVSLKNHGTIWDWNLLSQNLCTKCQIDFKLWAPLSDTNQSILDRVRLAYIFGRHGSEALIITEDDEVWVYALDNFSCSSFRKAELADTLNATLGNVFMVDVLNKQCVKDLSFGLNQEKLEVNNDDHSTTFLVVCTSSGNVIQFGRPYEIAVNEQNQNSFMGKWPTLSKSDIIPVSELGCLPKISEVACGSQHCLALSTAGQVFCWGSNDCGQIGSGDTTIKYYDIPFEILNALKNKRIVKISCGFNFSVVVLDDGRVYTWGRDVCEHNKCQYLPVLVALNDVVIREIACGFSNVLAVSNTCELYVWGMNNRGQLGLGDKDSRSVPTRNKAIEKVVDVAASYLSFTSVAITANSKVFMWGDCSGAVVLEPVKTPHKSLMEVFAYYGTPKITYKPIIRQSQLKSVSDTMRRAFNNETTSNLIIKADGKEIFVHRSILRLRSDYFRVFLQDPWTNENQKTVEVKQAYNVIYSYLQYLYTGDCVADPKLTQELLILADEYQDLSFKELCEEKIQCQITIDNVGILFPLALKLNAKKVQESCILFASSRLSEVVQTPAFRTWDQEAFLKFFVECNKRRLFKT